MPTDVYLYDAVRTPFGKYGGALAGVRPDDLAAHVVRTLAGRAQASGKRWGVAAICIGVGQGLAVVLENLGA